MKRDVLNNPEKFSLFIRGRISRPDQPPLIFQRSNGGLQKKVGPIIPTNPKTRLQQLNRILFHAAINNADSLSPAQRKIYLERSRGAENRITWRLAAVRAFRKPNAFDRMRFGECLLFGGQPQRDAFRFDEIGFDDAFLIAGESLPLNAAAIRAKYPNIDISSIFPEG
ncbi:hypothetical protein JW998_08855 [candidate division KSB1 bacterium]|nr:hypothetical protein [candidate division KSB1 bacterium]